MKDWRRFKITVLFLSIILLLAWVYRDSFNSRFFQDDKILLNLSTRFSWWYPIPNYPFRPVSIQIFYGTSMRFFGLNPLGYHLVLFSFFTGTLWLIYLISQEIFHDKVKSLFTVFFYALNISLFPLFFWIATSYFSIGGFFFFLTIYLFLQKGFISLMLALFSFLLALGNNELAFVTPLILFLFSGYFRFRYKRLTPFFLILTPLLLWRIFLSGIPKDPAYALVFSLQALSTVKWYFIRALNLPEGINRTSDPVLLVALLAFLGQVILAMGMKVIQRQFNLRFVSFCFSFFLVAAVPFYFLPGHMSSYYLSWSIFGFALLFADLFSKTKLAIPVIVIYLLLTIAGLAFLGNTHWIILKNTGPIGKF